MTERDEDEPAAAHPVANGKRRRRWPYVTGAVVVVLVGLGPWIWYVWLPGYRPSLDEQERFGVDVSNHQGEIDWERVAGDDIEFAYIKATEGGDFVDDSFEANWDGADAAGLARGAYHFFTLCRPGDVQAANFLGTVPDDPDALPPAIDLELAGNCSHRPSREWVEEEVGVFVDEVESATGQPVVFYVGDDFAGTYEVRSDLDRPIWHRRILIHPEFDDWWIWQFSGRSSVDGIEGDADLNVMRGAAPRESHDPLRD